MERTEDLGVGGLKIIQDDDLYKFTSDAILLTRFTRVKKNDTVADFCSGSGIVGLHLYGLCGDLIKRIVMFEMQKSLCEMSSRSIKLNNLEDKICAVNVRLQEIAGKFLGRFSLIVCNPPYMPVGSGAHDKDEHIALCRRELALSVDDLAEAAARCLKFGGRINLVHRADRLADVFFAFRKNGIEPKKLQFVCGGGEPYLFLLEAVKGGKSGLKVLNEIRN